jgi:hypothetical protein
VNQSDLTSQIDASTNIFRIDFEEEEEKVKIESLVPENGFETPPKEKERIVEDNLMIEEE